MPPSADLQPLQEKRWINGLIGSGQGPTCSTSPPPAAPHPRRSQRKPPAKQPPQKAVPWGKKVESTETKSFPGGREVGIIWSDLFPGQGQNKSCCLGEVGVDSRSLRGESRALSAASGCLLGKFRSVFQSDKPLGSRQKCVVCTVIGELGSLDAGAQLCCLPNA